MAGRHLNRFSQDTLTVDESLPFMFNIFLAQSAALLGTVVVLVRVAPWTLALLLGLAPLYYRLQYFYRASSRELKRLESVSRSPLFAHFAETLDGAATIRAFGAREAFMYTSVDLLDHMQRVSLISNAASQWLTLRLQVRPSVRPSIKPTARS
jgi:ATP-binding cassette, subfamily C (CFTR/MRP), member 10